MINIVSRTLLFKKVSGPKKVVENLIKGLDKLGYPYVLNARLDTCPRLYIHDDKDALAEIAKLPDYVKPIIGPNLYVVPREVPSALDLRRTLFLQPSQWTVEFWKTFGYTQSPLAAWPTGIDTSAFTPSNAPKEYILVYFKQRFPEELAFVEKTLKEKNLSYRVLVYGNYKEADYQTLMDGARYIVWLGRQESQGIALEEAMARDIPILVCEPKSVGHCTVGGEFNEAEAAYTNTTSAYYFDDSCGIKIKDLSELPSALGRMEERVQGDAFHPRDYVVKNLSLAGQATALLKLYETQFKLPYDAGFHESPMKIGKWKSAKWYYAPYLKMRYYVKITLVKLGLWKHLNKQ